ncbi:ATP-dependent DNA helicase [Ditylenchus destructor]|nr:ATP-dependent DNA helicase [Ditylenchus destructor]
MPPKRSNPIAPMETRSRAKAKKNAEPELKVDAKRYRKDTMQVADEDGSAHGNGGESDNGPAETPFRPVKDSKKLQDDTCVKQKLRNTQTHKPSNPQTQNLFINEPVNRLLNEDSLTETFDNAENYENNSLAFSGQNNCDIGNTEANIDDADLNYTIANAIQVLNEMYNKWLADNTRSSTADTSINAFINYCKMTFDDLFENLSSNAGVNTDTLIAAFETGTILNETISNNDLSEIADSTAVLKKKAGRPSGKRGKQSIGRQRKEKNQAKNRTQNYRGNQTPEQRNKRLSQDNARIISRRSNETQDQRNKRLTEDRERHNALIDNRTQAENIRKESETLAGTLTNVNDITPFSLGSFDFLCKDCGALHFEMEASLTELNKRKENRTYDMCCSLGKIAYEKNPEYPPVLKSLFLKKHPKHREFYDHIRNVNSSFGFVSINAHVKKLTGQYHYRIQGPLYHLFNQNAHPIEGETHTYGQLFFLDTQEASNIRANNPVNKGIDPLLFFEIENELRSTNPFIKSYHMMYEIEKKQNEEALRRNEEPKRVTLVFDRNALTQKKNISYKAARASHLNEGINTDEADEIGRKTILHADYPGSIKYYQEEFRKSMIMAKRFGPPDLFITITFGSDNQDLKNAINVQLPDGEHLQQQTNFRPDMKAYADIANLYLTEKAMSITLITGMPEPNMDLNDLIMNIDTVQHKNIAETMFASMNEKQKEFFTMIQEAKNQRVEPEEIEFLEALTKLGDGELQDNDEGEFEFPEECISDNVLRDVYGTALATKNYESLHERVILTPYNKDANTICEEVLSFIEGAVGGLRRNMEPSDAFLQTFYNSTTNLPNRVITWNFLHFLQEMPSLLNKRAPSSSARGVRQLAVGTLGHLSLGTSHRQIIFFTFPWMMRMRAAHFLDHLILSHIAIMYFSYGSSTFAPLARFFCALNLQFSAHCYLLGRTYISLRRLASDLDVRDARSLAALTVWRQWKKFYFAEMQ